MADTLWADVSEFQKVAGSGYPYRVISFRANDGTYRDAHFAQNYAWARKAVTAGRLDLIIVYTVYEPDGHAWVRTLQAMVGAPHPRLVVMVDVESWGGRISGDRSADINAGCKALAAWLGGDRRVWGYGNAGDLGSLWRTRGDRPIVLANYAGNPAFPHKIAHQYTDRATVPPFGRPVDLNSADGYSVPQLLAFVGVDEAASVGQPVIIAKPKPKPKPSPWPARARYGAAWVKKEQGKLQQLGYPIGAARPDGKDGSTTQASVRKVQAAVKITVDGIAGPDTDRALSRLIADAKPGYPLPHGYYFGPEGLGSYSISGWHSHNADVKTAQRLLNQHGYRLQVDGLYTARGATSPSSSNTGRAVADLQHKKHLKSDGLLGPATWAVL